MTFSNKLNNLMKDLGLSQTKVSELTGISKSNISQYVSGKHEPSTERKKQMARSLGVKEDYFNDMMPEPVLEKYPEKITTAYAAKVMHKSVEFVQRGLQQGTCPFGYAVKMKQWEYYISPKRFMEYIGAEISTDTLTEQANMEV